MHSSNRTALSQDVNQQIANNIPASQPLSCGVNLADGKVEIVNILRARQMLAFQRDMSERPTSQQGTAAIGNSAWKLLPM